MTPEDIFATLYKTGVIASWSTFRDGCVTYYRVIGQGQDNPEVIMGAESREVLTPIGQEVVE